jgi:hypothetical protein
MAAVFALVHARGHRSEDRAKAEHLEDEALETYRGAAAFMHEQLDPVFVRISGEPLTEAGVPLERLVDAESTDREQMARIFDWR